MPIPGIFFVVTTASMYLVSEWTRYELIPAMTSPIQPLPVRIIEWGPNLVTQVYALAAIVGAPTFLLRISSRLFRKPSQGSSSKHFVRLATSIWSGVVTMTAYAVGVMAIFEIWKLNYWTLQMGIVAGAQYPLFRVWRFLRTTKLQ